MLDTSREYLTKDDRKVTLITSKSVNGQRIFVGHVEGVRNYHHWTEEGTVFGDRDKLLNLKEVTYEAN